MEENCYYHRPELPLSDEEPLKELKSMLSDTFKNKQVLMWGIPLNMESSSYDASETAIADVILLKFLNAQNSKVQDAYNMLIKSLEWRKAYGADSIGEQDLGFKTLENRVCYNMGCDKQGRSICYTDYSHFFKVVASSCLYEQTSLYKEIFSIYENQEKFIRWRIQVIERLIRMLSFKPGDVNSIVLVQDYKHHSFKYRLSRPLFDVDEKISSILRDNYPGMISYKILLNVAWIDRVIYSLSILFNGIKPMCKLVISDEASSSETLYKYISPEHIPQEYGGIYTGSDYNLNSVPFSGIMAKGGETVTIKIEGIRAQVEVWWDVVAGGSYFEYSCRFVPDEEAKLAKMLTHRVKAKKVSYCYYTAGESGKIVISIHSRVTKVVSYRYKVQDLKV